jgi:ABC-type hemin transport system ATPase subunit
VKLLRRQFEPQAGRILIDGQDIAHIIWDSLNEAIAEVPQVAGVFHRAVRDNIRYAKPDAAEAEVSRAASEAYAHDFILGRASGYDTIVGEQGIKLSGGERQRIAIARALVRMRASWCWTKRLLRSIRIRAFDQEALWTLMRGGRSSPSRTGCRPSRAWIASSIWSGPHRRGRAAPRTPGQGVEPMRGCGTARWAASSTRRDALPR